MSLFRVCARQLLTVAVEMNRSIEIRSPGSGVCRAYDLKVVRRSAAAGRSMGTKQSTYSNV